MLASTCWVSAPRRERLLPPHILRVTTACRRAWTARQFVASKSLQGWSLLTRMLQRNSSRRLGGQGHDSCEPSRTVRLSFHNSHHRAILNRHFIALGDFVRKISPLECPVSRDLDVLNFQVATQTALSS